MARRCRPVLLWEDLDHWEGDGIAAWVRSREEIERLQRLGVPVVNVSSWLAETPFPSVLSDNRAIGRLAAEHLLERGLERFAFFRVLDTAYARDREAAFAGKIRAAGFECRALYPRSAPSDTQTGHPADPDESQLADMLRALDVPVGVLAVTDFLGRHIIEACQETGIHVPDELAVVGVDNETLFCEMAEPQLSSVALAGEQMGFQAASLLDDLIVSSAAFFSTCMNRKKRSAWASISDWAGLDVMRLTQIRNSCADSHEMTASATRNSVSTQMNSSSSEFSEVCGSENRPVDFADSVVWRIF